MSCFMGYNPLVAKEVKITTWIKEFDGDSPVYPSFPNEGDCFVVFATDEDALTHNALSKKTYTNGEWADAEGGGGGSMTIPNVTLDFDNHTYTSNVEFGDWVSLILNSSFVDGEEQKIYPFFDELGHSFGSSATDNDAQGDYIELDGSFALREDGTFEEL